MIDLAALKTKKTKGNGPKYRTLGFYVKDDTHNKLERICKHTGAGRSTVARRLVEDGIDRLVAELDTANN